MVCTGARRKCRCCGRGHRRRRVRTGAGTWTGDGNETWTRTRLIGVHELFDRRAFAVGLWHSFGLCLRFGSFLYTRTWTANDHDWSSVRDVRKIEVLVGLERMHSFPVRRRWGDRSTSAKVQVSLDKRRRGRVRVTARSDRDGSATSGLRLHRDRLARDGHRHRHGHGKRGGLVPERVLLAPRQHGNRGVDWSLQVALADTDGRRGCQLRVTLGLGHGTVHGYRRH